MVKINLKKVIIFSIILIIIIFAIIMPKSNTKSTAGNNNSYLTKKGSYTDNEFAFEFLKMENNGENTIYSPLSIKYALKMLNEGASEKTKKQIENVIGKLNLSTYNNIENVLSLANVMYINEKYKNDIKSDYIDILNEKYAAEAKYDAFLNADNINKWIEEKTFNQIKNLISDNVVQNEDARMILINALAIDMEWMSKFDGSDTQGRNFYLSDGSTIDATTMRLETQSPNILYYKNSKITAVAMGLKEYNNEQMEFIAIMPEDNLSDYVEKISESDYKKIINNLKSASDCEDGLDITIPKFSFDYSLKLKEDLINLGIEDAFSKDNADFSNMADIRLYVSDALHKANINFSEKGIKAAAVTSFAMFESCGMEEEKHPIKIEINKPFMYIIRDKDTDEIWFTGTVYKPNLWEDDK